MSKKHGAWTQRDHCGACFALRHWPVLVVTRHPWGFELLGLPPLLVWALGIRHLSCLRGVRHSNCAVDRDILCLRLVAAHAPLKTYTLRRLCTYAIDVCAASSALLPPCPHPAPAAALFRAARGRLTVFRLTTSCRPHRRFHVLGREGASPQEGLICGGSVCRTPRSGEGGGSVGRASFVATVRLQRTMRPVPRLWQRKAVVGDQRR